MAEHEFKRGDRVVFVKDDEYGGVEMPKGTLATYDEDDLPSRAPRVLLDTGERVRAWSDSIAPAEDHGTGDGSASDICAEPGCNCDLERRFPAPLDGIAARRESTPPFEATTNPDGSVTARSNLRFVPDAPQQVEDGLFASANRSLAAALRTGPLTAPLDPAKVKAGDTVTLERDGGRLPDQEVVVVTATEQGWLILILKGAVEVRVTGPDPWLITAHTPAPEPEPYVPDLKHIRSAYVDARHDNDIITSQEAEAEFDRWMATHVVIDPATVDVEALTTVGDEAYLTDQSEFRRDGIQAAILAALAHLGIEVPR